MQSLDALTLNIIELFRSIQGETSFTGLPTTFVRLARCNLRCIWCDTTYSFSQGKLFSLSAVIDKIDEFGCRYVCITGGEPLLQKNVYSLMTQLCNKNYFLTLETSGSLSTDQVDSRVHIILDIKCPGSRMDDKNLWENIEYLRPSDQVKFVLMNKEDYEYAKAVCSNFNLFNRVREILFSPVHGQLDPKKLVEWLLNDKLPARLNLQIHKFIWPPETKGV